MADGDTTTTTTAATTTAAPAWHAGLEPELLGHAQNKNWDLADPTKAFAAAAAAHREAQKLIGVPETELLRIPKPSAPEAEVGAFWNRIGVPKEAKEYDFTGIKHADGTEIEEKFSTAIRNGLLAGRVTKDRAPEIVKSIVKELDDTASARRTETAASVQTEKEALEKSWGPNREANLFVAKNALLKLGQAAGLPVEKAEAAWDALSKVGGIGAATAMEMLRVMGARMGEDKFVRGGAGGSDLPMTREAAMAEISSLKADKAFGKRLLEGSAEDNKRWTALHKIAYAPAQAA